MKYVVKVQLAFDSQADAEALYNTAKTGTGVRLLNASNGDLEGALNLHQCYHDEIPPQACIMLLNEYP